MLFPENVDLALAMRELFRVASVSVVSLGGGLVGIRISSNWVLRRTTFVKVDKAFIYSFI